MSELNFVQDILGDDAFTQECAHIWVGWEGKLPVLWQIPQRTAVCEISLYERADWIICSCQTLAGLDARGRHVCVSHWQFLWTCTCGAWLPEGMSGYCSPRCPKDYPRTWLGQRLGARYT
jgi:hypothetical protein